MNIKSINSFPITTLIYTLAWYSPPFAYPKACTPHTYICIMFFIYPGSIRNPQAFVFYFFFLMLNTSILVSPPHCPPKSFNNSDTFSVCHGEFKVACKSQLWAALLTRCAVSWVLFLKIWWCEEHLPAKGRWAPCGTHSHLCFCIFMDGGKKARHLKVSSCIVGHLTFLKSCRLGKK